MTTHAPGTQRSVSIEEVSAVRQKTEAVAAVLRSRVERHLETLQPVLNPRRLLGRHVRGGTRDEALNADRALHELRERFASVCGRPFNLNKELGDEPLGIEPIAELHPYTYSHPLPDPARTITITSPVQWILSFRSGYALADLRKAIQERTQLRAPDARQFVLNALVMQALLEKFPELGSLLNDLRYELQVEKLDGLGDLPCVSIRIASLPSFRPADAVIATAIRFSGVPAFIELIDFEAARGMVDPLRREIEREP